MKYICMLFMGILLIGLACTPVVHGAIFIDQIFYDATGSDDGKEFIDIKNYANSPVSIASYILYESGRELWSGKDCSTCFLFANESFRISVASLPNTKGFLELNSSTTSDVVGYGSSIYFLGSPAKDVPSGFSLKRMLFTGNNSEDFIQSDVLNNSLDHMHVDIEIKNSAPELVDASIIKENNSFFIQSVAIDDNGISDIVYYTYFLQDSYYVDNYSANVSSASLLPFSEDLVEIPLLGKVSELSLAVIDSQGEFSEFMLLPIFTSFFEITEIKPVSVFPGDETQLDISFLAGKDATYTISIDSLYGKEQFAINSSVTITSLQGDVGTASIPITVPKGIPSGFYKGTLDIVISTSDN